MTDLPTPPDGSSAVQTRSFATVRSIAALILREMATSYGRDPGGYIWAVLQPMAAVGVMILIFKSGLRMRNPPLGTDFGIFFATGMVPFMAWGDISRKLGSALTYSKALLVYPSVTLFDALAARFLLNFLTQLLVAYVVFTFFLVVFDTGTTLHLPGVALAYAMAMAFAVGIGTVNAFLTGLFPVWRQIWSILTRPLMIISGVIFLIDDVPQPFRDWLWWNPLVHVVGQMRKSFYPQYDALYLSPTYVFLLSSILIVLGLLFLDRYKLRILHL